MQANHLSKEWGLSQIKTLLYSVRFASVFEFDAFHKNQKSSLDMLSEPLIKQAGLLLFTKWGSQMAFSFINNGGGSFKNEENMHTKHTNEYIFLKLIKCMLTFLRPQQRYTALCVVCMNHIWNSGSLNIEVFVNFSPVYRIVVDIWFYIGAK